MKVRLLWVGSNSDDEFRDAIERYLNRIKHFLPIEAVTIAPEKDRQSKKDLAILHAESARLVAAINPRALVVVADERGDSMDSLKFARWFERLATEQPHGVDFVLGGDLGLDDEVRRRADRLLSLSAMTLPHQIARLVLVEQIYRACTVMRNIRYHK